MGLAEYRAQVLEWQREYGVPARAFRYDPTEVEASCRRCHKIRKKMSRHHICYDLFFARLRPDLYAARYIQFLKEDTAKLCDGCHKRIHEYYLPIVERMKDELRQFMIKRRRDGWIPTEEWCEKWRAEFKQAFEEWLATPLRRKLKKRKKKWLPRMATKIKGKH